MHQNVKTTDFIDYLLNSTFEQKEKLRELIKIRQEFMTLYFLNYSNLVRLVDYESRSVREKAFID